MPELSFIPQRVVGIRHRVKQTAEGEAHPTQIFIFANGKVAKYDLATETDELDWALNRFPVKYRAINEEDNLSSFLTRHIKWRKLKEGEDPGKFPTKHLAKLKNVFYVAMSVPAAYDGLQSNDLVAMVLGGSGDKFAFALTHQAEKISAGVWRISPFNLKENRGELTKEDDGQILADLAQKKPELFYPVMLRDKTLMLLRVAFKARMDIMKDRIACEQRIRERLIGSIFCSQDGLYPEGAIDELYEQEKANDQVLAQLLKEEAERERELIHTIEQLDVYQKIFAPIEGIGPMIAARIITPIVDIRRFETAPKFKAYCGVHVLENGEFPRRRRKQKNGVEENGGNNNWQNNARAGFYLAGDQFNRRPSSEWGLKLREYKIKMRQTHLEIEETPSGKKKYTDGHIHKMASWRTITKFAEYIYDEWWALEGGKK